VSKRVATPKTITITRGPFGFLILLTSRHPVNEAKKKKKGLLHGISAERNMTFLVLVSSKTTQTPAELPKNKKGYFNSRDKSNEEI
jgi:hypothetical protein